MALPNPSMSFTPFDILTAVELNNIVENVEALADGSTSTITGLLTTAYGDGSITRPKTDWSTFSNNIKSATNTSTPTLTNSSQDLASSGASISFTLSGTGYAFVTVSIGIGSLNDFEFQPQIRLGGTVVHTFSPPAAPGALVSRAHVRGMSRLVTLTNGVNVLSPGVFLSSAGSPITSNGAITISAIVFGNVTA